MNIWPRCLTQEMIVQATNSSALLCLVSSLSVSAIHLKASPLIINRHIPAAMKQAIKQSPGRI